MSDKVPEDITLPPPHRVGDILVHQYAVEVTDGNTSTILAEVHDNIDDALKVVDEIRLDDTRRWAELMWREVQVSATEWK